MTLNLLGRVEVKVTVIDYLKGVLTDFPEMITGSATPPEITSLFEIRSDKERVLLREEQARTLHHSVEELISTSSRASGGVTGDDGQVT
jgi:hypothetical protein